MRVARRSQGQKPGGRSRRNRTGWKQVVLPLVSGVLCCVLALWAYQTQRNNQASFAAHALRAEASIVSISGGPMVVGPSGKSAFDQYGMVTFPARGQIVNTRVLLVANCAGVCYPVYQAGQAVTVYYNAENPADAQLRKPGREIAPRVWFGVILLAVFGVIFLLAAAINTMTVVNDRRWAAELRAR